MCGTGFLANIDESCTPPGSEGHCKLLLTRSSWCMRCVICVLAAFSCIGIVRLSYLGLGRVKTLKSESLAPDGYHWNRSLLSFVIIWQPKTKLGQLILQPISMTSFLYVVLHNLFLSSLTLPILWNKLENGLVWRLALQIFWKNVDFVKMQCCEHQTFIRFSANFGFCQNMRCCEHQTVTRCTGQTCSVGAS